MSPHDLPPARPRTRRVPLAPISSAPAPASAPPGPVSSAQASTAASAIPAPPSEKAPEQRDYEVGYGRPPVSTRFQKGRSGNPKGRKKGSKNVNTLITDLLEERITMNTPQGRRQVARIEVLLHKFLEMGFKGNARAIEQLLRQYTMAQSLTSPQASASPSIEDMTAADLATLELFKSQCGAGPASSEGGVA